tara:strand:- start:324 stop:464 length:141 start_codon:yes stop_codon:yes gene_type:complete
MLVWQKKYGVVCVLCYIGVVLCKNFLKITIIGCLERLILLSSDSKK